MKKIIFMTVVLSLVLISCKSGNKVMDSDKNIQDYINHKEYILLSNDNISIGFDNNSVYGSAGVNSYMGTYAIKQGVITFGKLGATMMLGSEEEMKKESEFLAYLETAKEIKINGDSLKIGDMEFIIKK